jgi:WD40 repeat protein
VLSPDGATVAAACLDKHVRFWNWRTGELRFPPLPHPYPALSVCISPDGRLAATTTTDDRIRVWDAHTGRPLREIVLGGSPAHVAFTHDGKRLRVWSGYRVHFVDPDTGKPVGVPIPMDVDLRCVEVSDDGRRIVYVTLDNIVRVVDGNTGVLVNDPMPQGANIRLLAIDRGGGRFAIGGDNGRAEVFDMETGRSLTGPLWHDDSQRADSPLPMTAVQFSPDGRQLLAAATAGGARLWDLGPRESDPIPAWLPDLAESVGGLRLTRPGRANETPQLVPVPYGEREATRTRLGSLDVTNDWGNLARWFLSPVERRAASPVYQGN